MRPRKFLACDCETDPFKYGRVPEPFLWGLYDGKNYQSFLATDEFVSAVVSRNIILFAHNGGKFDFMYLLPYVLKHSSRSFLPAQIINGRIVSMYLGMAEMRDSFSVVPESLDKATAAKKKIDITKLERISRDKWMDEIIAYNKQDCIALYDLMKHVRDIAGQQKTIASNAMSFARKQGIKIERTNASYDRQFRPFFFGGRTECFQPGTHHNIHVIDIRSAYPFAMLQDHATGAMHSWDALGSIDNLSREELQRAMLIVECTSHGAFPKRILKPQDGREPGLYFPHEYDEYHITGWEFVAALDCGLIENITIQSVQVSRQTINFRAYVDHWFEYKKSHPKAIFPIQYTIGKIMMNSLYGKLAQNPARYLDYAFHPAGTPIKSDEGWELHTQGADYEIHSRDSLWKHKFKYGVQWEAQPLYYNVATGASITGFCRAHLLRALHSIGREHVIYCDTDSIAFREGADTSALDFGPQIGAWEREISHAPIGHFAGKKLYAIDKGASFTDKKERYKIACKGSKLIFEDFQRIMKGETIRWQNDAPTFSLAKGTGFVTREIRGTAIRATK